MTVQDEQTHFQRLDELKLKHENDQKIATIKANADVEKARVAYKTARLANWKSWNEPLQIVVVVCGIGSLIVGAIFTFWWMWANSPTDTPDEMKQDRANSCTFSNGDHDGKYDQTWWPDAANGNGLCLPKGSAPPQTGVGS